VFRTTIVLLDAGEQVQEHEDYESMMVHLVSAMGIGADPMSIRATYLLTDLSDVARGDAISRALLLRQARP
jgi:hypothetical protein